MPPHDHLQALQRRLRLARRCRPQVRAVPQVSPSPLARATAARRGAPPPENVGTVTEGVAAGDRVAVLRAMLHRAATVLDDPATPATAIVPVMRQVEQISAELGRAEVLAAEGSVVAATPDDRFDPADI